MNIDDANIRIKNYNMIIERYNYLYQINNFTNSYLFKSKTNTNYDEEHNDYSNKFKILNYILLGWFDKDLKLLNTLLKYNKSAICFSCYKKCGYDNLRVSKTIPYSKIKKKLTELNICINSFPNIYCICNDCFKNIDNNFIVKAPKNMNDIINRFDINNSYNVWMFNLLQNNYFKLNRKICDLNNESIKLMHVKNCLEDNNSRMNNYIILEKEKFNHINKYYKDNIKLINDVKNKINNEIKNMSQTLENNISNDFESITQYNHNKISDDSTLQCKICSNNRINVVLNNCGHVFCKDCVCILIENYKKDIKKYNEYIQSNNINLLTREFDYKPELICPQCRCLIGKWSHIFI